MSILETINSPQDLRGLNPRQLETLAEELRVRLIETVARTGGHLAPNLGVVELTIALHLSFDSLKDRLIWDVGHQAYVHKLLTWRQAGFSTLRQYGGLSGFPKRSESPHDVFETGHSSTSISAALGMAVARDLAGEDHQVVAVIGDGAMTGGMAFEALNHCGHLKKRLIVVLNDNEMSIARNVGAMAGYLARVRMDPTYTRAKEDIEIQLSRIPAIGSTMLRVAERLKDTVKYLLVPGMLFEELGFNYFGPFDGHNIPVLTAAFREAKQYQDPVLIHVVTKKGKGYAPAERDAARFHGTGPFDISTGQALSSGEKPSYSRVFSETLVRLAEEDERVVAITAAMPEGTGLERFAKAYPKRFFDVGIAEQHGVTFAAGLAARGLRPVVAVYSTFLQRAYGQIVHDVCLQNLPVVLALDRAGLVGDDGPTHHGVFDLSYLLHIPNLTVMAPMNEPEMQRMLATALKLDSPVAIRYPRGRGPGQPVVEGRIEPLEIGKAEVLRGRGQVAIVALGSMVETALAAADQLETMGIGTRVINARFAKPVDEDLYRELAGKVDLMVTLEENVLSGGFGQAVRSTVAEVGRCAEVLTLGIPDRFVTHGSKSELLAEIGLDADSVAKSVAEAVRRIGERR
jgi:1-deoxy-D-xylulose-5-phosphate synthase